MRARLRRTEHDAAILRLAIPSFGALIAQPVYILTDTAIVGHLGTEQLAGLALASTIILGLGAVAVFLAYGTTGQVGRAIGAGDKKLAAELGAQALWLAAIVGTIMAVAVLGFGQEVLTWFDSEPAVLGHAWTYLRISALGLPFIVLTMAGTGYLRGEQNARTPLIVAVGTALLNLVLELWFVYGLDAGMAGSAWSTVLAEVVGGLIYLALVVRSIRERGASARPRPSAIAKSARLGAHLIVRTMSLRAALLLAVVVATTMGTTNLAAHEIVTQIAFLLALSLDAIAIAGQALVARHLGAGEPEQARAASQRMIELSIAFGVVVAVLLAALARPIASVFTDDQSVINLTAFLLLYLAAAQPIAGHVFALDGILIGAGDHKYLGRAMAASFAVFAVLATIVWVADAGIGWLWAALFVFSSARSFTLQRRFKSDRWLVTGANAGG